jgi:hypothetical protein
LVTKLAIAKGMSLPEDTVTSTLIVFGGKGMGKTNLGAVLVEEMSRAHLRWCVLDPLGVWWGLRHSGDGKGPGIECLILGGVHGDIPIEPTGGAVVADLVVDEDVNVVVDFSRKPSGQMWSKGERMRFVTDYATRLFQRQGELVDRRRRPPLFVVLDEAARYIPQMVRSGDKDAALSVSAWEDLVEEGRNVGIGVALLTQRSARINKSVSELADAMFAFRTVGPLSVGAITDWLGEHVPKARIQDTVEKIRALPIGSALLVSPGWLAFEDVVAIRARTTFDSSATPKAGERAKRVTGEAAQPDLEKYRERMQETINRLEADDPKALRRQIGSLQKELSTAQNARPKVEVQQDIQEVEVEVLVPVIEEDAMEELRNLLEELREASGSNRELVGVVDQLIKEQSVRADRLETALHRVADALGQVLERFGPSAERKAVPPRRVPAPQGKPTTAGRQEVTPAVPKPTGEAGVSKPQEAILNALAWFESVGIKSARLQMVAAVASVSSKSSGFKKNVSTLRTSGLIDYPSPGSATLTKEGQRLAQYPLDPATEKALQEAIYAMVSEPQAVILKVLVKRRGEALSKDELADECGVSPLSSGFKKNVSTMHTWGFVNYPSVGMVTISDLLFFN